jgi:predicted ArsR family transcriptional regulator
VSGNNFGGISLAKRILMSLPATACQVADALDVDQHTIEATLYRLGARGVAVRSEEQIVTGKRGRRPSVWVRV